MEDDNGCTHIEMMQGFKGNKDHNPYNEHINKTVT